jgi:CheY-like chemotaxis protein
MLKINHPNLMHLHQMKIALVDDDHEDIALFEEAFKMVESKNSLHSFSSAEEFFSFISLKDGTIPDLIFLDLNMPKINGIEMLKMIRDDTRLKNVSIAIYSTSSSQDNIETTLNLGANIYITKPVSFQALKAIIAKVMKINWNFHNSRMNRSTFVLTV